MEKINDSQMKMNKIILKPNWFSDSDASAFANAEASFKIKIRNPLQVTYNIFIAKKSFLFILLLLTVALLLPRQSQSQIRAGVGYLKILHGAREVGEMGTMTAALDHTYSFYANPGATGLLREWQWSASYTNWISDVYNASFLYGRKIPMPWSRQTKFLLGINYLGIPEFTNTNETATLVSGNNLVVTASIGQPLSLISSNLSVGANIKYFNSKLAQFDSDAFIFDLGLLYRTPRFGLQTFSFGLIDYIILSSGISITNLGKPVTFISEETPLPRTVRGGIAANLGRHHGLQFCLGLDYREIRDEEGFLTLGSELSWRQLFSLRMGYSWEDNLLGHLTFGGSIRLDDQILNNTFLGRNKALRFDLATNENNNVVDSPYHGTITHQPIGPERFRLLEPAYDVYVHSDNAVLKWELTKDPDLYDDVEHWLVVDRDSSKLAHLLENASFNDDRVFQYLDDDSFQVEQPVNHVQFSLEELRNGDYYWAVFAHDKDFHYRFGEMNHQPIAKFHVTAPDPRVIAIDFDYSPWITRDDYQGVLKFTISNFGDRTAENFTLSIYDSTINPPGNRLIKSEQLAEIPPGDTVYLELEWKTPQHGLHQINTKITKAGKKARIVNQVAESFYTIPKGIFSTQDTVIVQNEYYIIYDIPYVGKIFFDSSNAVVQDQYIREWIIEPPLSLFARRLKENPTVKIIFQGTIDPNSNETDVALANQRSAAVRDSLINMGVGFDQMEIVEGIKLDRRRLPSNPEDWRWVLEERRRVDITTEEWAEEILFKPLQTTYVEKTDSAIAFNSDITGFVPFQAGAIYFESGELNDSLDIKNEFDGANLVEDIHWNLNQLGEETIEKWLKKDVNYSLAVTDSLVRQFKVRPQQTYLESQVIGRERRYYVLAKFDSAKAFYQFSWTNLIQTVPFLLEDPSTCMCFHGHGCKTGPEWINNPLSQKRAEYFQDQFLQDVQKQYPDLFEEVKARVQPSQGVGESEPLEFRKEDGTIVILGDNNTPLGRQLNRRVMIFFYTKK